LGALPGVNSSYAGAINANGLIAGLSQNGVIDPLLGVPETQAVLWKHGSIIKLGSLGGNESFANNVNNRGQVVGPAANAIADPYSMFGWGTQTRAFLWQNGVLQDLGTLGGPDAAAFVVNDHGQIAGQAYTNSTPNPVTGIPTQDPFLWQNGKMFDLGTLGGTLSFPNNLNDRGQVVGQSNLAGDLTFHPFLSGRSGLIDLGTLGGDNGFATMVNERGDVIGRADVPGSQAHHGFLWRNGVMTDLGTVNGAPCSTG
jgi:probable HAF family extracellular repeat protein